MARKVYIFDKETQKMVDVEEYRPRSRDSFHSVIEDTMEPAIHPCTGEMIDSKRKFRKITREHGCEEVGNERLDYYKGANMPDPKIERERRVEAINRAFEEAKWK
jgi:hypothetical protein